MIITEVRGGRDDRRGASARASVPGDRLGGLGRGMCHGGKSGLLKGAMVGNTHRPSMRLAARIGKVPQKINRLGQGADGITAAVRVKRRGKSSPAGRVTGLARQTPSGARPNKGAEYTGSTQQIGANRCVVD